jgi:hypothetical protein
VALDLRERHHTCLASADWCSKIVRPERLRLAARMSVRWPRACASYRTAFPAAVRIRPVHVRHHNLTANRSRQRQSEVVML